MARRIGSSADQTAPKVRAAALRLIARNGYAAVSMRQIAAEVGVQVGALYLYTPDKQTLLLDLMRDHLHELLDAWQPPATGPLDALEDFTRHHIRFHLDRPDLVFIAYMELRNLTPANFATIEALRRRYEDQLVTILRNGQKAGHFDIADAKLAAMGLIALLNGVTTWFRDDGRLSRQKVEEIYWNMARKAVLAT